MRVDRVTEPRDTTLLFPDILYKDMEVIQNNATN